MPKTFLEVTVELSANHLPSTTCFRCMLTRTQDVLIDRYDAQFTSCLPSTWLCSLRGVLVLAGVPEVREKRRE